MTCTTGMAGMLCLLLLAACGDRPVATEAPGPLANSLATHVCDGVSVSLAECEALVRRTS